jgi:Cu-processing system permease protein
MSSLLSFPITRLEIIIGKFIGLSGVLATTIIVGFGVAGIIISLNVGDVDYAGYLIFIGASILIGLVFLSISLLISAYFKRRSTSMGIAILSWFIFNMIWGLILAVIGATAIGFEKFSLGNWPDWLHGLSLANPLSAFSELVSLNVFDITAAVGLEGTYSTPSFYTSELMIFILLVWIIVPLILAYILFNKKDI